MLGKMPGNLIEYSAMRLSMVRIAARQMNAALLLLSTLFWWGLALIWTVLILLNWQALL